MGIIIDKEFQALIPPLSDDEFRQLEENCIRDGIRDPLVTWPQDDGTEILIDGHNRWKISAKNSGIPFEVVQKSFKSREDAEEWILKNQLGRRNIDKWARFDLSKRREEIGAARAKERQIRKPADSVVEKLPPQKTRDAMGEMVGVSGKTYDKMKFIDEHAPDPIKQAARRGDLSINKAYQLTTNKPPAAQMKEFIDETQQRHEEFKDSDSVNIADIRQDKNDRKVLAGELYRRCLAMGKPISDLYIDCIETKHFSLREMSKELTAEQRQGLQETFARLVANITTLSMEVIED
mgnify:CR=1 FL=1